MVASHAGAAYLDEHNLTFVVGRFERGEPLKQYKIPGPGGYETIFAADARFAVKDIAERVGPRGARLITSAEPLLWHV